MNTLMKNPVRWLINSTLSPFLVIVLSAILAAMLELKLYRFYFRYLSFLDKFIELKEDMLGLVSMMFIFFLWILIHTLFKGKGRAPWPTTTIEKIWLLSICLVGDWSDLLTIAECANSGGEGTSSHAPPKLSSPGVNQLPEGDEAGPSRSPSWTGNSVEIRVRMEPYSETDLEGTSARSSIPRVGGDEAEIPILRAPSPGGAVEILDLPESPTSVSPPPQQDLNPSMEEGNDRNFPPLATDRPTEHSQGSSSRRRFFIPEIPPFRGRDPEPQVQPSEDSLRSEQILYEEKIIKVAKFFQSFYADNTGERRPTYPRCKRAISKMASSFDELVTLKNALEEGGSESNVFREFKRIVQEDN